MINHLLRLFMVSSFCSGFKEDGLDLILMTTITMITKINKYGTDDDDWDDDGED